VSARHDTRPCGRTGCGNTLRGKRGHGWPSNDGRAALCDGCGNPAPRTPRRAPARIPGAYQGAVPE